MHYDGYIIISQLIMQSNTKDKYAEMHKKINSYIERCYIT